MLLCGCTASILVCNAVSMCNSAVSMCDSADAKQQSCLQLALLLIKLLRPCLRAAQALAVSVLTKLRLIALL